MGEHTGKPGGEVPGALALPDPPPREDWDAAAAGLPVVQQQILAYLHQCGASYRQAVPSQAIAKALSLFPSYVREQAHQLVLKGLVGVRQGRGGGYYPLAAGWAGAATEPGGGPGSEPLLSSVELRRFIRHHVGLWRRYGVPVSFVRLHWEDWPQWVAAHGASVVRSLLAEAAQRARAALRAVDLLGQEAENALVAVLPHTTAEQAHRVVERLRERLTNPPLVLAERLGVDLKTTFRVASPPQDGDEPSALMKALRERPPVA